MNTIPMVTADKTWSNAKQQIEKGMRKLHRREAVLSESCLIVASHDERVGIGLSALKG
jgi:hypothetical protein